MSLEIASATEATVRWDRRRRWCRVIGLAVIVGLAVRPVAAATCVGDCKGAGKVDIADLIIGVNIALALQPVWSATSGTGAPPFGWGVFFRTGSVIGSDKAAAFSVRAIRGGS